MRLEYFTWEQGVRQFTYFIAQRSNGVPFSATNGSGYEGSVHVDEVFTGNWSRRYQAVCDDFT